MAIRLKSQSLTVPSDPTNEEVKSFRKVKTAAVLLQQRTQQRRTSLNDRSLSTSTTTCPSCEERQTAESAKENKDKKDSRIGSAIGKLKTMLNTEGSFVDTVKDNIVNATKNSLGSNDEVSLEAITPILLYTANRFTSISQSIQSARSAEIAITSDTSDLVISIYDVLESVVVAIADLIYSIINLFEDLKRTVVRFVADAILAVLSFLEGIKLGIIEIIVDFLNSITDGSGNSDRQMANTDEDDASPIFELRKKLLSSGGVYSNIITSLEERNDDSGLISILMDSATDMTVVNDKLGTFIDISNQALAQNTDVVISEDTIEEILNSIVDAVSAILNFIVDFIVTVIKIIASVIVEVANVIVSVITGILELIISILNAILGILSRQADTAAVTSSSLLEMATTVMASPIYEVMICQFGASSCTDTQDAINCNVEVLDCQNKLLSDAITK
jgi:hypothetical protein